MRPTTESTRKLAGCVALVVAAIVAYYPALHGEFVWDDADWTVNAKHLHEHLEGLWRMWSIPTTLQQYYPLTGTTFWLDYRLWGFWTFPYHLENVLLHAASALFFWRVLLRLEVPGAWIAAAIFALHPVMVESVAWITERKNVLSLTLSLAALLAYGRAVRWWQSPDSPLGLGYLALSFVLFVAALAAKITAFVLPPAILVLAWWKQGRIRLKRDLLPQIPFFATAIGLGILITWLERHHIKAIGPDWDYTLPERILVACRACCFYVGKFLWPVPVCFVYPRWELDPASLSQWAIVVALLAAIVGIFLARRRLGRGVIAAALCFIGALFPVLGFMNVYGMRFSFVADRWVYFSTLPMAALVGVALMKLPWRASRPAVFHVLVGVMLCGLGVLTWNHAGNLRNAETLWHSVLRDNPGAWVAHNDVGVARAAQGRHEDAVASYRAAIELKPDYADAHANLGVASLKQGKLEEAITAFRHALQYRPESEAIHYNLALALQNSQRTDEALAEFHKAIELHPRFYSAHQEIGNLLFRLGRLEEAEAHYRRMVELRPYVADVYTNLGNVHARAGKIAESVADFERALQREPANLTVLNNLALLLATTPDPHVKNVPRALEYARKLHELSGGKNVTFLITLATACVEASHFTEAAEAVEAAAQLAEENGDADQADVLRDQARRLKTRGAAHGHP